MKSVGYFCNTGKNGHHSLSPFLPCRVLYLACGRQAHGDTEGPVVDDLGSQRQSQEKIRNSDQANFHAPPEVSGGQTTTALIASGTQSSPPWQLTMPVLGIGVGWGGVRGTSRYLTRRWTDRITAGIGW